jgi:hypothetical protein
MERTALGIAMDSQNGFAGDPKVAGDARGRGNDNGLAPFAAVNPRGRR